MRERSPSTRALSTLTSAFPDWNWPTAAKFVEPIEKAVTKEQEALGKAIADAQSNTDVATALKGYSSSLTAYVNALKADVAAEGVGPDTWKKLIPAQKSLHEAIASANEVCRWRT